MCILGLCALIDLEHRPQVVNQVASQLLPAAILLFNGLKRAYACRAEHDNDEEDDDEDGEEDDDNGRKRALLLQYPENQWNEILLVCVDYNSS